ncbi:MAG TPA: hypothetical protein VMB91_04255 [Solirubrobacteraceae bacterium]|nr:hypothetical protein [Solirubrobacteraceae bacterium]
MHSTKRTHGLAIVLAAGTLAAAAASPEALADAGGRAPAGQQGWVLVPGPQTAASDAAVGLARDFGIDPHKAQEIIDAAYR